MQEAFNPEKTAEKVWKNTHKHKDVAPLGAAILGWRAAAFVSSAEESRAGCGQA